MKTNASVVALAVGSIVAVTNIAMIVSVEGVSHEVAEVKEQVTAARAEVKEVKHDNAELKKTVEKLQKVVLYKSKENVKLSKREVECLAKNIYFEAGVEDHAGKVAVAQVTLNRVREGRWGNDVCKVVYARAQFSWTLDKTKRNATPKGELWNESVKVANEFVNKGVRVKNLDKAQYYHTDYINQPNWAQSMKATHKIGQHIFYQHI